MDFLYLLTGLATGVIAAWVAVRIRYSSHTSPDPQLLKDLETRNAVLQQQLEDLGRQFENASRELITLRENYTETATAKARIETYAESLELKLKEHREELALLQSQMKEQFSNIANEIVTNNSRRIQEEHQTKLADILFPLREKIEKFETQVRNTHEERIREHQSLKEQLLMLQTLNKSIGEEAGNLVAALKGQAKTQGNWGEMILEKILERSGLVKGREYHVQSSFVAEDGRRYQPDVIISLPENRCLVIDSKVSLIAYERYCSCTDDSTKDQILKEHLSSVRRHVKDLSSKNYQNLESLKTLDFVLLFVPVEPAFALAVEHDQELFNDAFEKNIVIVSTSTLLATLRTVASVWRLEYQNKNTAEIARQAGDLYDKFAGFIEDMSAVGKKMQDAQSAYENTMKKLYLGRGNLVSKIENLKKLGLRTSKQINPKLIEKTEDLADNAEEKLTEIFEPKEN